MLAFYHSKYLKLVWILSINISNLIDKNDAIIVSLNSKFVISKIIPIYSIYRVALIAVFKLKISYFLLIYQETIAGYKNIREEKRF